MGAKKDYEVGYGKPPKERQFGAPNGNPRRKGMWDVSSSARYKLEQMIKLDREALLEIANDDKAPVFECRIAKSLLQENNWKITESILNQVYGTPKQTMEVQQVDPKPLIDLTEVDEAEVKDDGKQPNDSAE